jgi:hypothetical protein
MPEINDILTLPGEGLTIVRGIHTSEQGYPVLYLESDLNPKFRYLAYKCWTNEGSFGISRWLVCIINEKVFCDGTTQDISLQDLFLKPKSGKLMSLFQGSTERYFNTSVWSLISPDRLDEALIPKGTINVTFDPLVE